MVLMHFKRSLFVPNHQPTRRGAYTMSLCDFVQALHLCRVQLAALDFIAPIKGKQTKGKSVLTHRIHVWYIYLHLVDFDGKCM